MTEPQYGRVRTTHALVMGVMIVLLLLLMSVAVKRNGLMKARWIQKGFEL